MSTARSNIQEELRALEAAIKTSTISEGSTLSESLGQSVLKRGACITALVMLETFIRDRTEEILFELSNWNASFEDLPRSLRNRATLGALPHIEKYARMLKRQGDDFEALIVEQVSKMASVGPPRIAFTKFVAGDYTGNITDSGVEDLLKSFQVKDCWRKYRLIGSDIGFGVPSIREMLRTIIRNRHRSAHVSGFDPNSSDVVELPQAIRLVAICIDTSLSASCAAALQDWRVWVDDNFDWTNYFEIYFVEPVAARYSLKRLNASRSIKIVEDPSSVEGYLPRARDGKVRLVVRKGADNTPLEWSIL